MKTSKRLFAIFWSNLKFIFWDSSQSRKLKLFIQNKSFYENDFNRRYDYSKKIGSFQSIEEFSSSFLDHLKDRKNKVKKEFKSHAQIVENTERYIGWLKNRMPLNKKELEISRLKVLCSTAMFGQLINQLIYMGYVEAPIKETDQEVNVSKTAQILLKSFYIPHKDGKGEVLFNHLAGEISNSTLSDENKKHIMLPPYKK